MSRTKYYPFWKAPLKLWVLRVVFGLQGIVLLSLFVVTLWNAATKHSFTMCKLRVGGAPFTTTLHYSSDPHSLYWSALLGYCTICFVVGSLFSAIAYAATFRAVIPGAAKKKAA